MRAAILAVLLSGCSLFGPRPPATFDAERLVDSRGMSLYTYDRDRAYTGESQCGEACARDWPPFVAPADARRVGKFGILRRDDGVRQWAYEGKPLYYNARDQAAGDTRGHGLANLWRLAR